MVQFHYLFALLMRTAVINTMSPGIPDPPEEVPVPQMGTHKIPAGFGLRRKAVLGGLHHEYRLERMVA